MLAAVTLFYAGRSAFSADLGAMFPAGSATQKNLAAIAGSGVLNRAAVLFTRTDGKTFSEPGASEFLEIFAQRIEKVPGVSGAMWRKPAVSPQQTAREITQLLPLLRKPSDLPDSPEKIRAILTGDFTRMALYPGQTDLIEQDPCGFNMPLFLQLEKLLTISGIQLNAESKLLVSPDGKHALVIAATEFSPSDSADCRQLEDAIRKSLTGKPIWLTGELVSAHRHTCENEREMKRDLRVFSIASGLIFLLLFAVVYRLDWRGFLIPLIPFLAFLPAAAVMTLLFRPVLVLTLAMGGIMVGIGVDYGIHLYGAWAAGRGLREAFRLTRALFFAFLTTISALCLFLFSGTPGLVQFGAFACLMLAFTFAGTLLVLPPVLFFFRAPLRLTPLRPPTWPEQHPKIMGALFALLIVSAVFGCIQVHYDGNIRNFDAAYGANDAESHYREAFAPTGNPSALLYRGNGRDTVLETARRDAAKVRETLPGIELVTATDLFPTQKDMADNMAAWKDFAAQGKLTAWEKDFLDAAEETGFEREFFQPFFKTLRESVNHPLTDAVPPTLRFAADMLMRENSGRPFAALTLYRAKDPIEDERLASVLTELKSPAVQISENRITDQMAADIGGRIPYVALAALALVAGTIFMFTRTVRGTILAILPMAFAVLAIAGAHGLAGIPLNLAVAVSGIIILGIAVDYGLIAVNAPDAGLKNTFHSLTLSALTTAAGGFTVVFTHHAMLRSAGLTIVSGIAAAWAAAVFLLPLLRRAKLGKTLFLLMAAGCALLFSACRWQPFEEIEGPDCDAPAEELVWERPLYFEASAVADYLFGRVTFLLSGEIAADDSVHVFGLSPTGLRLFELKGQGDRLNESNWLTELVSEHNREAVSELVYGWAATFLADPRGADCETQWTGIPLRRILREIRREGHWKLRFFTPDAKTGNARCVFEPDGTILRLLVKFKLRMEPEGGEDEQ